MTSRVLSYPFKVKTKFIVLILLQIFLLILHIVDDNLKIVNLLNNKTYIFNDLHTNGINMIFHLIFLILIKKNGLKILIMLIL